MRRLSFVIATASGVFLVLGLLGLSDLRRADSAWPFGKREEPQRPLPQRHAKFALTNDESKVLSVVFEASQGTASAYDTLYADFDSAVDRERAKKLTAKGQKKASRITCPFPPLNVDVPQDEKAGVTSSSCSINFCHCRQSGSEIFCVTSNLALRQGETRWQYSSQARITPSDSADKATLVRLAGEPQMTIETKPDLTKKGNLGIALNLMMGANRLECMKGKEPLDAHVVIKTPKGKIVHEETQKIDKFAFG